MVKKPRKILFAFLAILLLYCCGSQNCNVCRVVTVRKIIYEKVLLAHNKAHHRTVL
jgi:hypothetical protein